MLSVNQGLVLVLLLTVSFKKQKATLFQVHVGSQCHGSLCFTSLYSSVVRLGLKKRAKGLTEKQGSVLGTNSVSPPVGYVTSLSLSVQGWGYYKKPC